jgi:predicted transcriptional regulator
LWITLIGWFLLDAARASYAQVVTVESLRGLRVRDVMTTDCPVVDGRSNLQTFADEYLLRSGRRCFFVEENSRIVGLITPHEVKEIERTKWPYTTVDDVMRPLDQLHTIAAQTPLTEALERMGREDVNQLPVVEDGRVAGVISRSHILQVLQTRAELNM